MGGCVSDTASHFVFSHDKLFCHSNGVYQLSGTEIAIRDQWSSASRRYITNDQKLCIN
jgi:hypothetical protein